MLSQPPTGALRRAMPCLPGGPRWPYFYNTNPSKLPRLPFDQAVIGLTWRELRELSGYLERLGYLEGATVAELIFELDGYLSRLIQYGRTEEHDRAYHRRQEAERTEWRRSMDARGVDLEGATSHAQRHLIYAKHGGDLPRLASLYRRLAGRKVGA